MNIHENFVPDIDDGFSGKKKCVICEKNNYLKGIEYHPTISLSFETKELYELSLKVKSDHLYVICLKCSIGNAITAMGAMLSEEAINRSKEKDLGYDLISKVLLEASNKYHNRSNHLCLAKNMGISIVDI
jgi:hypothetical protein